MISYEKLFSSWVMDRLLTPEGEAYEKKGDTENWKILI